ISPANPFYTIDSRTGKIRTSGVTLDRESTNSRDMVLMRTIIVSAVDQAYYPGMNGFLSFKFIGVHVVEGRILSFSVYVIVARPAVEVYEYFLPQVQAVDPDKDENGRVTLALQMGMPRLDFYLNSSTGVLTSMVVLDREQIGLYYLRIIAHDAGEFPRTSTSTLTVSGDF
ncbi:hypothetical protein XENOCAPTIV_022729, partial [Xenoophorus captivus]